MRLHSRFHYDASFQLNMQNILITGTTGQVGAALLRPCTLRPSHPAARSSIWLNLRPSEATSGRISLT